MREKDVGGSKCGAVLGGERKNLETSYGSLLERREPAFIAQKPAQATAV